MGIVPILLAGLVAATDAVAPKLTAGEVSALSSAGKAVASVAFSKRRGVMALQGMAATADSVWLAWSETDAKARLWIARVRVQ
jgi:hypothetical protein